MGGHLSRWMFAGAALRGRAHHLDGRPCQDYAAGRRANGVTAIALADGAGSAPHSEIGARCVVEACLDFITARFTDAFEDDADRARVALLGELRHRLEMEADMRGIPVRDLASTLLFVGVTADGFVAGHLGDGVIGCERQGELAVLSHPQRGEFLNETVFVTSSAAPENLRLERGRLDGQTSFILMSDGSADSLYARRERALARGARSIPAWLDVRAPAHVEDAITRALRDVIGPKTADDCAIAVLRDVTVSSRRLAEMDATFQRAFLNCKTRRSLPNRLSVAAALSERIESVRDVAARAGVSAKTARAHLRTLRAAVRVPEDVEHLARP